MGKLRTWQQLHPLFSGNYKRLKDDFVSSEYSKLIIDEPVQDQVSYSCGHCGHIQKLEAEELNNIVGHAFRLAYTAHLQKAGTSILDIPVSPSQKKKSKSQKSRKNVRSPCPKSSESRKSSVLGRRFSSKKAPFFGPSDFSSFEAETTFIKSEKQLSPNCEDWGKSSKNEIESSQDILSSSETMRTPSHNRNVNTNPFKESLPGLQFTPKTNSFLSPESNTSNSPTDLNTLHLLEDKPPPLSKDMNLTLGHNERACVTKVTNMPLKSTATVTLSRCHIPPVTNNLSKCSISDNVDTFSSCGNVSLDSDFTTTAPPPLPERFDSPATLDEPRLRSAAWFQAGIPREIALEVLSKEPVGAFMVRESTSKPGCYALSLRVPRDFTVTGIAHYLIVHSSRGYKIKGFTKDFPNLTALITHHSVMPELLPCPLSLHRYNPTFNQDEKNDSPEDDPDYSTLSAFRKMMADLNV